MPLGPRRASGLPGLPQALRGPEIGSPGPRPGLRARDRASGIDWASGLDPVPRMPVLQFAHEWIDPILAGAKTQTLRRKVANTVILADVVDAVNGYRKGGRHSPSSRFWRSIACTSRTSPPRTPTERRCPTSRPCSRCSRRCTQTPRPSFASGSAEPSRRRVNGQRRSRVESGRLSHAS